MADIQTGFGSFLSFYLADRGWSQENVGFVLTAGGLSGVVAQMPGGALVDVMRRKRLLVAIGVFMIAASAGPLALSTDLPVVFAAEVLHGATGGIIGPAIAAISLGLVGRPAMSGRIGRNLRFDAAGNALTAAFLGVIAQYVSKSACRRGAQRGGDAGASPDNPAREIEPARSGSQVGETNTGITILMAPITPPGTWLVNPGCPRSPPGLVRGAP